MTSVQAHLEETLESKDFSKFINLLDNLIEKEEWLQIDQFFSNLDSYYPQNAFCPETDELIVFAFFLFIKKVDLRGNYRRPLDYFLKKTKILKRIIPDFHYVEVIRSDLLHSERIYSRDQHIPGPKTPHLEKIRSFAKTISDSRSSIWFKEYAINKKSQFFDIFRNYFLYEAYVYKASASAEDYLTIEGLRFLTKKIVTKATRNIAFPENASNPIILTVSSTFLPHLRAWLTLFKNSQKDPYDKAKSILLIGCLDDETYNHLNQTNLLNEYTAILFPLKTFQITQRNYRYHGGYSDSPLFLWSHKMIFIHCLLKKLKLDLIYSDVDAFWSKDIRPIISNIFRAGSNFIIQSGSGMLQPLFYVKDDYGNPYHGCMGFFACSSNPSSILFINQIIWLTALCGNDQWAVNYLIFQNSNTELLGNTKDFNIPLIASENTSIKISLLKPELVERKPLDGETQNKTYIYHHPGNLSLKKIKCVIIGNCQTVPLYNIFSMEPEQNEDLEFKYFPPVHVASQSDILKLHEFISEEVDFIFTQSISDNYRGSNGLGTNYLSSIKNNSSKLVTFPNMHWTGYHPELFEFKNTNNQKLNDIFDYHNILILKAYCAGSTCEECLQNMNYPHHSLPFVENLERTTQTLKGREAALDVKISDFILNNYQSKLLFHVYNHPTNVVLDEMARRLASFIDTKNIKLIDSYQSLNGTEYPILQSVRKALGLKFNNLEIPIIRRQQYPQIVFMIKSYYEYYDKHRDLAFLNLELNKSKSCLFKI